MKKCIKCKVSKSLTEFHKHRSNKDGLRGDCKACVKVYDKARYEANKEYYKARDKARYEANAEAHPEKYAAARAKRRAGKAAPHWLTDYQHKQIELKYWISNFLTEYTGVQHQVDHIVPLNGKNICGLHVPDNLQVITAEENREKYNKYERK